MKALFKIGPFTQITDIPRMQPEIRLFDYSELEKPLGIREVGQFGTPAEPGTPLWRFRFMGYKDMLGEQVALYKYDGK